MLVAAQVFAAGLYFPPVFNDVLDCRPPQMIISVPVQIAVCDRRKDGALIVLVGLQLSVVGLYLPPGSEQQEGPDSPPQTII